MTDEELFEKLILLDMLITGKNRTGSLPTFSFEDFIIGTFHYYCSDCGYSRIIFHEHIGKLALTSNSLQKAKDNWDTEFIKVIREDIEKEITLEMSRRGW